MKITVSFILIFVPLIIAIPTSKPPQIHSIKIISDGVYIFFDCPFPPYGGTRIQPVDHSDPEQLPLSENEMDDTMQAEIPPESPEYSDSLEMDENAKK